MPTNSEVNIRGGYIPFGLKRDYHLDIFGDSLNKITQQHEKALEEENNILAAINNVPLNEADAPYKQQLLDYVKDRVSKASRFGNLSYALTDVKQLAGEVASNAELFARAERNKQYQTWRKDLENRAIEGKIDKRTADRILEQNPYNFIPRIDNNGNVIGGYNWNDTGGVGGGAVEIPVNKISLEPLFKEVDAIVAQHVEGGAGITSRNEKGEVVSNYATNAAFATKSSSTVSYKDEKTIQSVFDELVKMHPELVAYLEQMKKDDAWEIKKLEQTIANTTEDSPMLAADRQKLEELRKNLYTDNGLGIKSNADYLFERSNRSLKAMAYRNYNSDISITGGPSSSKNTNTSTENDSDGPLKNTDFGGSGKVAEKNKPKMKGSTDKFRDIVTDVLSSLGL